MSYARQAVTRLTLNMGLPDAQGSFSCTLGDVNRRLEVTLIDHGEPFALPPDWTAFLAGVKPDGTRLANSCVVDRGRIIYDFSGGAEIATCPGVFAVVFEVYDELGELVATPKVWVHVADNAGARIVNSADQFSVLSELIGRINGAQEDANDLKVKVEDLMDKAVSAGTVTIPMSEWTDAAPTMASVAVSGVDVGSIILMLPADEKTRLTANNAKLSAYPVAFAPVGGDSSVSIFRAEAETIPDSDMTFAYIVLKTGFSFATPVAAIVGVDAYGEGGGGSGGGGSVDPEIVNQVLVAASAAQTSAENAATSAEAANTAKSAAETAAERAEAAAERAESAGGAGGGGESEYTGSFVITWKDSRLGMGNTNGDYFTNGAQIDVYPANERTYRIASEIGLYVYMVADHTSNDVIIFGLDDGAEVPDETMTFNFNVTDMGTDDLPVATLHPEWSGSGGGSADEATIDAKIAEHNTANDAHQDIRLMIKEHEEAVNALLNSDDETLNETKEIVAYIKSNKSLIDAITTSKVNVSDIIDNLTTNVTNKPLSAAQGVALKALIDGLQSGKLNATDLTSAINTALAQAKASGEFKGETGETGPRGPQGPAYTLTETDKALIVAQVIESLGGNPIFGYVDEDNNIIVQGNLGDGTYSVKYEMEDGSTVDIGNLVLDTNVYYSITKNLTNCAIDNSATQVVAGGSYSATVTANSGYTLDSVSVTMGGSAVSVSGGVISIASVTGNIVITAVAEEKAVTPNYTNLANPNSSDWMEGYRLNSSGEPTETTDGNQTVLTHYIDCVQGDVIRIKGLTMGSYRVALYTGSTTKTNYKAANPVFPSSDTVWECEEESPGVYKFIIKYASTSAMRFSGIPVGTSNDVIITKNEPIS